MNILDLSAGNRAVWFNKNYPDAFYVDCRAEVKPDLVADTRALPPEVGKDYDLVVFDPPHVNFGANAEMSKTYGHHTTADIRDIIKGSAKEAHRVTREDALMAFKWNDHDQRLESILALMDSWWEPLFGHKTSVRTKHSCTVGFAAEAVVNKDLTSKNYRHVHHLANALKPPRFQWCPICKCRPISAYGDHDEVTQAKFKEIEAQESERLKR